MTSQKNDDARSQRSFACAPWSISRTGCWWFWLPDKRGLQEDVIGASALQPTWRQVSWFWRIASQSLTMLLLISGLDVWMSTFTSLNTWILIWLIYAFISRLRARFFVTMCSSWVAPRALFWTCHFTLLNFGWGMLRRALSTKLFLGESVGTSEKNLKGVFLRTNSPCSLEHCAMSTECWVRWRILYWCVTKQKSVPWGHELQRYMLYFRKKSGLGEHLCWWFICCSCKIAAD